jgi:hypothetical protein
MVDGDDLLQLVGDELSALVEKQHAELLAVGKRLRGAAIVEHGRPRREHGRFLTLPRSNRLAAACTSLSSVIAASPSPLISASGLTSRRGNARNSTSSRSS